MDYDPPREPSQLVIQSVVIHRGWECRNHPLVVVSTVDPGDVQWVEWFGGIQLWA